MTSVGIKRIVVKTVGSLKLKNDNIEDLARKRKFIYERGSDFILEFKNGEIIKVNKAVLAIESKYFDDIFFGSSSLIMLKIRDYDRELFQTFLDCLFGLKSCSVSEAMAIYPIAHRYQTLKCIQMCINVLKPKEMNENVCLSLNLAVLYKCEELIDVIMTFLKENVDMVSLIENTIYSDLLEPKTMARLINNVVLDSYVWSQIYNWGIHHLKSRSKDQDIRSLFAENGILDKLLLSHFESVQSIFQFHKLTEQKLLECSKILQFLENNVIKDVSDRLPEQSSWFIIAEGDEIKEIVHFKNSLVVSSKDFKDGFMLNIKVNPMYLIEKSTISFIAIEKNNFGQYVTVGSLKCKVRLNFKSLFSKDDKNKVKSRNEAPDPKVGGGIFGSLNYVLPHSSESFREFEQNFDVSENISFFVRLQHEFMEIKSVEISYNFTYNTRILKTLLSGNFLKSNELYFTEDVFCNERKILQTITKPCK